MGRKRYRSFLLALIAAYAMTFGFDGSLSGADPSTDPFVALRVSRVPTANPIETFDLKALGAYPRWCGCADSPAERAWLKRVNDDRNGPLAARIDALHGAGQRLLVAVGALHMSGPQALPRLLAERGFTVEALHPAK